MKLFGQLAELTKIIFRQNNQEITLDSNTSTTYTAARQAELPPGDADSILVGEASTQTLTNKTIDGDNNTVQDLPVTAIKTVLADADKVILRDNAGVPTSAKIVNANVDAAAAIDATKLGNGDVDNTELSKLNGLSGNITTDTNTQTLTNKTIDGDDNTLSDIAIASLKTVLADANKVIRRDAAGAVVSDNAIPNSSALLTTDATQTLTNKTLTSPELDTPLIDDYFDINEEAAPGTPASGKVRVYAKTDKRLYKKDDTGVESSLGGGTGTGEINAILNPSGETATTGWAVTGTATVTRQASGGPLDPVIPTALRMDSGAAADVVRYDFTLPTGLENRKLKIEFYMAPESGAASGEWKVELRDQALTKEYNLSTDVSGDSLLPNQQGKFTCTFDSDGTNTLRLQFVRVTGSNHIDITNIIVGPGIQPQGAVVGEWQPYTATFSNGSIVASQDLKYRRVGSSMEITGSFVFNGTGVTNTAFGVSIPSGFTYDSSANNDAFGAATFGGFSGLTATGSVGALSATQLYFFSIASITVNGIFRDDNAVNNANIGFTATIPIVEWAGSGTLNVAENAIQYASNSNFGDADDSTSFAYGSAGSALGVALTDMRKFRVRFPSPILATDELEIQISQDGEHWFPMIGYMDFTNVGYSIPALVTRDAAPASTNAFGVALETVNDTDVDVYFGKAPFLANGFSTGWNLPSTYRWRVRKSSSAGALGFATSSSSASGLAPKGVFNGTEDSVIDLQPRATNPTDPASSSNVKSYVKGSLFILQYNDAGTVRYKYLDMTGTGVTWVHTTTPP